MTNRLKEAALTYAARNWAVFPVEAQGKKPLFSGKFQDQASKNHPTIKGWWERTPGANIGLPTGPLNRLWVLDVDGEAGLASLDSLMNQHGRLDPHCHSKTGGGGFHFFFSWPDDGLPIKNSVGKVGNGIDVRGDGGYVVAPPSVHASGDDYQWLGDEPLPQPAPAWLLALVRKPAETVIPALPPAVALPVWPVVGDARTVAYAQSALEQAAQGVAMALEGQRNDTLNREAFNIGQLVGAGVVDEATAKHTLTTAARQAGLPAAEIAVSLNSGLSKGKAKPRKVEARLQATAYTQPPAPSKATVKGALVKPELVDPQEGTTQTTALDTMNGLDLLTMEFPPMRWAVEGLIPEGLSLLAGRPKCGKSWLAFQLGIAIATGGQFLGQACEQGGVLFLGLEDNRRRLQSRLRRQLNQAAPVGLENLSVLCELPQAHMGGLVALEAWLEAHPDTRLIVLDTMGRFIPSAGKGDTYEHTTAFLGALQKLAFDRGLCLVAIHHTRKKGADAASFDEEDFTESVLGSTGIVGACDAVMVLERPRMQAMANLRLTGRDVVESTTTIAFDEPTCSWALSDAAIPSSSGPVGEGTTKTLTRAALDTVGQGSLQAIFEATGLPHGQYEAVRKTLQRMAETGEAVQPSRGIYQSLTFMSEMSEVSEVG